MSSYLRIKICGITNEADAVQAAQLGADAIGLNFYKGSPRYVTPDEAGGIIRTLPPFVDPVGIFVFSESPPNLGVIVRLSLRTIQLHCPVEGSPPVNPFRRVCVIPAFSVGDRDDLLRISQYLKQCQESASTQPPEWVQVFLDKNNLKQYQRRACPLPAAILVDAHVPGQYGGTGKTAPWNLLADFQPGVPVILAGGLTPENVAEAVRIVRPYGVDVASGIEKSPGQKDAERMKRFIENAREAAARL
jgi:phosphoribosylanthranilate isomerase